MIGMKYDKVTETGKGMRNFESGAVRDAIIGKGRYDLLSPLAIDRLAKHYQNGANKYADRNWEKGMPLSIYVDSMLRHGFKFLEGSRVEDHLAAVMWNASAAIHIEEMVYRGLLPAKLLDLPNYTGIKFDKPKTKRL